MEKLEAHIFDGPQIRELMKDPMFDKALSKAELSAWQSLKSVVTNFLGTGVQNMRRKLKNFFQIKAQMSIKLHFLHHI